MYAFFLYTILYDSQHNQAQFERNVKDQDGEFGYHQHNFLWLNRSWNRNSASVLLYILMDAVDNVTFFCWYEPKDIEMGVKPPEASTDEAWRSTQDRWTISVVYCLDHAPDCEVIIIFIIKRLCQGFYYNACAKEKWVEANKYIL